MSLLLSQIGAPPAPPAISSWRMLLGVGLTLVFVLLPATTSALRKSAQYSQSRRQASAEARRAGEGVVAARTGPSKKDERLMDGLSLTIARDCLAISALLDDARHNEARAERMFHDLRAVVVKHFGHVVSMHDSESVARRLDQEITQMKARAGITAATSENRCGRCWTLLWNDSECWACRPDDPRSV